MDSVNKTLYIPLYGKAYVSRNRLILHDPTAEEIWAREGFPLKGKSKSKWLAYYMGMRSAVFDRWMAQQMKAHPDAVVVHIGCGMDSRIHRVGTRGHRWFDIDFPDVIAQRKLHFEEAENYRMLGADVRTGHWLEAIPAEKAIVALEGVSMYLRPEELTQLLTRLREHFVYVRLLMDCYTEFAAKASKYKNPINDVGVTQVYGLDEPKLLESTGFTFLGQREMTPREMIEELAGMERRIFQKVFAGKFAGKMYRLYEFEKKKGVL